MLTIPFLKCCLNIPVSSMLTVCGCLLIAFSFFSYVDDFTLASNHFHQSTLSDFPLVVTLPSSNVIVPLEIDEIIPTLSPQLIQVLGGVPGCGKSLSLYRFLKDQHVIWLSGKLSVCQNLTVLDFLFSVDNDITVLHS
ncbi:hypothetical protein GEMRC1_003987 [Eukaryota sp. GEM-RC1]